MGIKVFKASKCLSALIVFVLFLCIRQKARNYFPAEYGLRAQLCDNGHSFIPPRIIEYYKNWGNSLNDAIDFLVQALSSFVEQVSKNEDWGCDIKRNFFNLKKKFQGIVSKDC